MPVQKSSNFDLDNLKQFQDQNDDDKIGSAISILSQTTKSKLSETKEEHPNKRKLSDDFPKNNTKKFKCDITNVT